MRRYAFLGLFVTLFSAATAVGCRVAAWTMTALPTARGSANIPLLPDGDLIAALVPSRTTLSGLLSSYEIAQADATALVATMSRVFDLRKFRSGQPFTLDRLFDGRVRAFSYEIDGDRVLNVAREGDTFDASIAPIPKQVEIASVEGAITRDTPSLVQALDEAGERIDLALAMAGVFSGEIDFNSELQPGDSFRLLVERATREDGRFAGYGPVIAAEFVNAGRPIRAVRFTPPGGRPDYFDEEGRSLKRFFLKSPLKFEPRVSSRFSASRRHPVLKITRAHNGVDYAAPTGAPVVSVSGGTVTFAGWTGGGGRTVRVRHGSGYESEYLHLSSIAVSRGARVAQGELVGRVGATGLATGAHLHYGLKKNGRYVNPVVEHRNMPPGEPVPAVHLAAFHAERDRFFARFNSSTRATN